MYNRDIEREIRGGEGDFAAFKAHGALIQAVVGTELLAGGVAFYVELNVESLTAGLQRAQPDAVYLRGLGGRNERVAGKVEGLRRALIPGASQSIGSNGALPSAVNGRNSKGERWPVQMEVSTGNARGALIGAVESAAQNARPIRLEMQLNVQRTESSSVVARDVRLLLRGD